MLSRKSVLADFFWHRRFLGGGATERHYSGFDAKANAFFTVEVNFSQLQANEPSGHGAGAIFDRLAADFADGTFLGVSTMGGPIGWSTGVGMLPASATGMLFCC